MIVRYFGEFVYRDQKDSHVAATNFACIQEIQLQEEKQTLPFFPLLRLLVWDCRWKKSVQLDSKIFPYTVRKILISQHRAKIPDKHYSVIFKLL